MKIYDVETTDVVSSKISKSKLKVRVSSHEGVAKQYSADLNDFDVDNKKKLRLAHLRKELRTLLRARANLEEAQQSVLQLERQLKDKTSDVSFEYANRALFAYATSLYGACFVRGGIEKEIPLGNILKEIELSEIHKTVMIYRHKLISHLDEDNDLRTDELGWDIIVTEDGLNPKGPHLNGTKVLLTIGTANWDWVDHMQMVIVMIDRRKEEISAEVNSHLGNILITE